LAILSTRAKEIKGVSYLYSLPTSASFTGKGLLGYTFGPLNQKDLDVYYIQVEKAFAERHNEIL
jgi:hypothetical protein